MTEKEIRARMRALWWTFFAVALVYGALMTVLGVSL